jgi:2,3-bisphosphoglycerate-independent phosphoglycerate mutase
MKRIALVILDGWGVAPSWGGNAISTAKTVNYYRLLRQFPYTTLKASGEDVGLPGDEVGNSEVGHMNIGAGEIVEQDVSIINKAIESGEFFNNKILIDSISQSKQKGTALHLMGILSDAGIHSHIAHLKALIELAAKLQHPEVYLHLFTDGRDTDQYKGLEFIDGIEQTCRTNNCGRIATLMGRVFLDRKGSWAKTETAYNALTDERYGLMEKTALGAVSKAYRDGESDEFISPRIIQNTKRIEGSDCVIFFNFRSDRTRQLTQALLSKNFEEFKRNKILTDIDFISFIPYGIEKELNVQAKAAFIKTEIHHTIGQFYEQSNLKQFHIAETEKYAHVTFFINGNRNEPYIGEDRLLIPSPQVRSYAEKPEMSAEQVKDNLIKQIKNPAYSLIICNFANGDMVGHTGDYRAALVAVATIDKVLGEVSRACIDEDVVLIVTADHGNIEQMVNPIYGGPDTEHTKNPVPLIVISNSRIILKPVDNFKLSNLSGTILDLTGLEIPQYFKESVVKSVNEFSQTVEKQVQS